MRKNIFQYAAEALEEMPQEIQEDKNPTGVAFTEKEYVFYARMVDDSVLAKAQSFTIQEQWEIKIPKTNENASAGRIRIRRVDDKGAVNFILTTKIKLAVGEQEVELPASEDAFKQFKLLAGSGMHKKRYIFPIENTELKWEIDVFFLSDMKMSDYVKIDLEVKDSLDKIPTLPPGFTDIIYNQKSKLTEAEKKKIQGLYDAIFRKKNEHLEQSSI